MLLKQWVKKEDDDTFIWTKQKQSTVTIMTSGDGKGTFFSNVKTKREVFRINILKKRIFKKI